MANLLCRHFFCLQICAANYFCLQICSAATFYFIGKSALAQFAFVVGKWPSYIMIFVRRKKLIFSLPPKSFCTRKVASYPKLKLKHRILIWAERNYNRHYTQTLNKLFTLSNSKKQKKKLCQNHGAPLPWPKLRTEPNVSSLKNASHHNCDMKKCFDAENYWQIFGRCGKKCAITPSHTAACNG